MIQYACHKSNYSWKQSSTKCTKCFLIHSDLCKLKQLIVFLFFCSVDLLSLKLSKPSQRLYTIYVSSFWLTPRKCRWLWCSSISFLSFSDCFVFSFKISSNLSVNSFFILCLLHLSSFKSFSSLFNTLYLFSQDTQVSTPPYTAAHAVNIRALHDVPNRRARHRKKARHGMTWRNKSMTR